MKISIQGRGPRCCDSCQSAWKILSLCYHSQGEEILGFTAASVGTKRGTGSPGLSIIAFDLFRPIYNGESGEIWLFFFKKWEAGFLSHFCKWFLLNSWRKKWDLPVPQFAHFARKLEEYLRISLEVLKGLSNFCEAFWISAKSKILFSLHKY